MAKTDLDRLLVTLGVTVDAFAICEVKRGFRLVAQPTNAIWVHHVLIGTLHLTVPGAQPVVCQPGCVVAVPAGLSQSLAADAGPAIEILADEHSSMTRDGLLVYDAAERSGGDLRVACGLIMANLSGSFGLLDRMTEPLAEDLMDIEVVRPAFAVMLNETASPRLGTRALTGALMKACLVFVLRRFLARTGSQASLFRNLNDPRLGKAVMAVLDTPASPHTVASLAAVAGMSRSLFAREFQTSFSMTPMEFVAKTRLHHAAGMLRSTTIPITTIAASIGFSSRSHFSRAFRDAYGTDPRTYRKRAPELDAPAPLRGNRERFALQEEPDDGDAS